MKKKEDKKEWICIKQKTKQKHARFIKQLRVAMTKVEVEVEANNFIGNRKFLIRTENQGCEKNKTSMKKEARNVLCFSLVDTPCVR